MIGIIRNGQQSAGLCQRFHLQYTRHHTIAGKVSLEKMFVIGNVLDGHNVLVRHFNDLIDQQEGITVR